MLSCYDHLFTVYYDIPDSVLCLGRIFSCWDSDKSFPLVLIHLISPLSIPYFDYIRWG